MDILLLDIFDSLFLLHCSEYIIMQLIEYHGRVWVYRWVGLFRRMKNNDIPY